MEGLEIALFSAMSSVMSEAIEKAKNDALSLADIYVQVKYDDQTFSVFDDAENMLAQATLDNLEEWREANGGEDALEALITLLRKVLDGKEVYKALRSLDTLPPFSVVLVDSTLEPIIDLVTIDDEIICLHDDLWEKIDKELDEFFEQLMADTK